jgi:ABC-type transport system involved in multi-copper enzyme maturation permease subunit
MSAFLLLWREALLDAVRRRLVFAIAAASVLSLLVLDTCAGTAQVVQAQGVPQDPRSVQVVIAIVLLVIVGLWVATLAGLLSADHLAQALEDGHASTVLARPVRRHEFAFARLAGALTVALAAGALLLGMTSFWLATRGGLPPMPAILASATCAISCVTIGALAMAASLALPRLAIWLLVFALVFFTTLGTALNLFWPIGPGEPVTWVGGFARALDLYGPPIARAMLAALAPWLPGAQLPVDFAAVIARACVWAAASLGILAAAFRKVELR